MMTTPKNADDKPPAKCTRSSYRPPLQKQRGRAPSSAKSPGLNSRNGISGPTSSDTVTNGTLQQQFENGDAQPDSQASPTDGWCAKSMRRGFAPGEFAAALALSRPAGCALRARRVSGEHAAANGRPSAVMVFGFVPLEGGSVNGTVNGIVNGKAKGTVNSTANRRVNGRVNRRANGTTSGKANGRANVRANSRVNGRVNGTLASHRQPPPSAWFTTLTAQPPEGNGDVVHKRDTQRPNGLTQLIAEARKLEAAESLVLLAQKGVELPRRSKSDSFCSDEGCPCRRSESWSPIPAPNNTPSRLPSRSPIAMADNPPEEEDGQSWRSGLGDDPTACMKMTRYGRSVDHRFRESNVRRTAGVAVEATAQGRRDPADVWPALRSDAFILDTGGLFHRLSSVSPDARFIESENIGDRERASLASGLAARNGSGIIDLAAEETDSNATISEDDEEDFHGL